MILKKLTVFRNFNSESKFVSNSDGFNVSKSGIQDTDPWWGSFRCRSDADSFGISVNATYYISFLVTKNKFIYVDCFSLALE